ncbi:hypothetical protein EDB89DRAFT_1846514 [Lactarius sanguifluus]|nr:hypothetical protein EDB89DRAFT_1846514 [Lactarius sanguifluus]
MGPSGSDEHSIPSDSFDQDPSWTQNQPPVNTQQAGPATAVPSRPASSSGSVQTWSSLPPPYSPSEASSRNSRRPFSEPVPSSGATHITSPASPTLASRGLPPPAPPTILDPPPVRSSIARSSRAPHEPFLSDAPPPADSWIAVETSPGEYRLIARLPGFRRDAITLAARRRRVLHVVADSWEPDGGHFERRISFGYDADLGRVRAEFDGEILRVIVPRRTPALTWYGEACE